MLGNYWAGRKVTLRAVESRDISLFEMLDDEVSKNVDAIHFPQSRERRQAWLDKESQPKLGDSFRWVAENKDGAAVGTIEVFACNRKYGTFKYGIAIAEPYRQMGYAKEMVLMVLRYYFHEMGYQKATPHVYSFNDKSIKLHESLGFKKEGQLRNMVYTNGQYYDEIYYGMTKREFEEQHGR